MDAQALLAERLELFDNAYNFKPNKRTPMFGEASNWMIFDAGFDLNEAVRDYALGEAAVRQFHERYQFDSYLDFGTRFATRVSEALGARFHHVDETGQFMEANDRSIMSVDEYQELIADRTAFYWSKLFKRYVKEGLTLGEFKAAMQEYVAFNEYRGRMSALPAEYGIATLPFANSIGLPFETVFNYLRGIKGAASDLRRNTAELKELCDALWAEASAPALANSANIDTSACVADIFIAFLGHSILSASQFGEFYWPYVKQVIDFAIEHGKKVILLNEAAMLRFAEYFESIPRGVLMAILEQDDVFEFRRRLPNVAIVGGMPVSLLGHGTPEQCIDYAKHLIDELGPGYVFANNKFLAFPEDAKRENLLATTEFVRSYQP